MNIRQPEYSPISTDLYSMTCSTMTGFSSTTRDSEYGTTSSKAILSRHRIMQRPVVNPIFEAAQEFTLDSFWKTKLMQAARGKFPKGFRYSDGFLILRGKTKPTTFVIPNDPRAAMLTFISCMNDAGIYSDGDINLQNDNMLFRMPNTIIYSNWKDVPHKMRESMLEDFIRQETTDNSLNEHQVRTLRFCIFIGIKLKIFDNKRIKINHQTIFEIEGLERDDNGFYIINARLWNTVEAKILKETIARTNNYDNALQPLICYTSDYSKKLASSDSGANLLEAPEEQQIESE